MRLLDSVVSSNSSPGARLLPSMLGGALPELDAIAAQVDPSARAVRVVAFYKSEQVNWALGWHQDRVVAVRDRVDVEGFSGWSRKASVWHAEPPLAVLESMFFLRVHIDPATEENGALEIALASHRYGRVPSDEAGALATSLDLEVCRAERGDVLAAKALMLHRSGPSKSGSSRRAIRVDYAVNDLPAPLAWAN